MVSRDQWLKYGALLLIVVFVGETVFLGLSNFNSAGSAASPTPEALSFTGTARAAGRVSQLGFSGLAMCNSSSGMDAQLRTVAGVRNALFATPEVLAVQFGENTSVDELVTRVAIGCRTPFYRTASVDLTPAQVVLNTSSGPRDVSTRQLESYFLNQGFPGFQAFVSPWLKVGDALNVDVTVVVRDNQFVSVSAEQPQQDVLESAVGPIASSEPAGGVNGSGSTSPAGNESASAASANASGA